MTMYQRSCDTVVLVIWLHIDKETRDWDMGMLRISWHPQGQW